MKKIICASLITLNAYAAEMAVDCNVYSNNNCAYYSSTTGAFKVTYKEKIPWGSKVELIYAFNDSYRQIEWFNQGEAEMVAIAPYTWQIVFEELTSSRGEFGSNKLNFVFRITLPDGSDYYDNGGISPMGHYSALMPGMSCTPQTLQNLSIIAI